MMNNGRSNSYNSTYPFTQTQWQELENQALIYKYMASGIPIPSDLLLPIKRSFYQNPSSPFIQPTMGWNCYQIGYGRKAEDPEPGRCRRTDGKKWRCSKEAYPDSKYCERHMHRGKNRSRKPVEISLASSTSVANSSVADCHVVNDSSSSSSSFCNNIDQFRYPNPLLYSHPYQSQNNTASNFGLDSGSFSSSTERDYRYYQGMKDEYGYMADTNGGDRGSSWELRPLGLGEPRLDVDDNKNKHCFVLGADFKQEKPVKERDFFDLDWPQKSNKGTWMGLEEDNNNSNQAPNSIYSKTNLSISIPMGLHDFPQWFVSLCSFMLNFMCVKLNTCSSN